jgi:hypothetical protein
LSNLAIHPIEKHGYAVFLPIGPRAVVIADCNAGTARYEVIGGRAAAAGGNIYESLSKASVMTYEVGGNGNGIRVWVRDFSDFPGGKCGTATDATGDVVRITLVTGREPLLVTRERFDREAIDIPMRCYYYSGH